jgi:hypothetical protein
MTDPTNSSGNDTGSAPIALFVYRRPGHLARALEGLSANPEARDTEIYIFSDGPKDQTAEKGVERVRRLLGRLDGFNSMYSDGECKLPGHHRDGAHQQGRRTS